MAAAAPPPGGLRQTAGGDWRLIDAGAKLDRPGVLIACIGGTEQPSRNFDGGSFDELLRTLWSAKIPYYQDCPALQWRTVTRVST